MASVLLNPTVNFVFIFLLTAFDTADGIGFLATLHAQKEGSGSFGASGSMVKEEQS